MKRCAAFPLVLSVGLATSLPVAAEDLSFVLTFERDRKVSKMKGAKDLKLREPSGLSLAPGGEFLTVDDERKRFFVIDRYKVKRTMKIDVAGEGFEGVAYDGSNTVYVVEESRRRVMALDAADGRLIASRELLEMKGVDPIRPLLSEGDENKGLEGVAVHPETGVLYVINEGLPRLLIMISPDLATVLDHRELSAEAGFAVDDVDDDKLDVSGLAFDSRDGRLWIVSDKGESVFRYDVETHKAVGRPLFRGKDGERERVKKAEGVAFDAERSALYVITDRGDGAKPRLIEYSVD